MRSEVFYIVDVFAENPYEGNQLAIVREAAGIPDPTMARLAREMNFSETTFILSESPRDGGYDVRIFTPGGEIADFKIDTMRGAPGCALTLRDDYSVGLLRQPDLRNEL